MMCHKITLFLMKNSKTFNYVTRLPLANTNVRVNMKTSTLSFIAMCLFSACATVPYTLEEQAQPAQPLTCPQISENLVINGSFENPPMLTGNWMRFVSIEGWKLSSGPAL